jgi:P27 family predicted phage terminase small subunit
MKNSGDAPKHLSKEAKTKWNEVRSDYSIDDAAGLLLLRSALEAFDRLSQARVLLRREGCIVTDRFGQPKQHPATLIEQSARQQMHSALRALRLEPGAIE